MRKPTIYEALRAKLGREPTDHELRADVFRILGRYNVCRSCGVDPPYLLHTDKTCGPCQRAETDPARSVGAKGVW